MAIFLATAAGIGRLPKSPGTFGSLPGVALGWLIHVTARAWGGDGFGALLVTLALLGVTVALAYWSIDRMERALGIHDDQRIVIDEVAGQAIAVAALAPGLWVYVAAFVAFRVFDIAKPSLIGYIDREVPGTWGTLGDDLLAGLVAGLLVGAGAWAIAAS